MKLVIIHETVENDIDLINSFNSDCILRYTKDYATIEDILNSIQNENNINNLGFIYHYPGYSNLPFYEDNVEVTSTYTYFSNNLINLINGLKLKGLQDVDILTCSLNYIDFTNEVTQIKNDLAINIRYSLDQTGNNPQGDWILESDNIDVRDIYFNNNINYWHGILTGSMNTYNLTTFLESGTTFITEENNSNGGKTYKLTRNINWSSITHPNYSFSASTNFIQLEANDIFDGQEFTITLSGSTNGLFSTGSNSALTDVSQRIETASIVRNLGVIGGNANNNTGFVIRQSQNYFKVIRCYSTGSIGNGSGGIAGNQSGLNGVALIQNCYSSGTIASNGGGICGSSAASGGVCIIQNCYTTGSPGYEGGFVVGRDAGTSNGKCILQNCYATGATTNAQTGLAGVGAGHSGFFVFQNCYYPNDGTSMTSANAGNNNGNCIIHNSFGRDASGNVNPRFYSSISGTIPNFPVTTTPPYLDFNRINTLSELSYGNFNSAPKLFENEYTLFKFTDKNNFFVQLKKSGYFRSTNLSYPQLLEFIPITSITSTSGSLTVNATNGIKPYTYSWSTGSNNQTISNISFGTYSVTVSDSLGFSNISSFTIEVGGNVPSEPLIYSRPLTLANAVELYWYPPLSDGGNPITSYQLECSNISYSNILASTERKTTIRNLVTGNSYVFGLKAMNAKGNSNIALYNYVMPGYKPDFPTTLDFTNSITDYSMMDISFINPSFTGNSTLTYNSMTMIPVDVTGNVLSKSTYIHNHSNEGSNIFDSVYHEDFNTNYNYRTYIQSVNTVNDSDKNYFSSIMNPSLPTSGLKLWLDPYDLTTLTFSNSKIIRWEDKSKNKANATISESRAPTYDSGNALINFNGNQYLSLPNNTLPSSNSSYSIFTYVSTSNITRNNQWFLHSGSPTANLSLGGLINSNSIVHSWWTNQLTGNLNISTNISYLVELTFDAGIRRTFINGSLVGQDLVSNRNSGTANNLIGTNSTFTGNLVGSVGDIIVYDRILNNLERNSVKNYLERKKYNLSFQNIGNVITWLDATDPNYLFDGANEIKSSYNDYVYNWIDRSYSNNNASQSNIANLPVRRINAQNNLDAIEFNQSFLTLPTAKYPLDAFIVLKLANISDQNGVLGIGPSGNNYSSLSDISGSRWAIDATSNSLVASTTETSSNFLLMEWSIGNNNNYIRRYGSNIANVTTGTWTLPNNSNIYIGNANGFDFSKKFKGYIGEIMMFNKQLDDGERYPIEGYLAWKWGLQSFLNSNHPYKNSAPYLFYKFLTNTFSPANYSPWSWFDSSDTSSISLSGSNVTSIQNKGSNGTSITPQTIGQVTYNSSYTMNGTNLITVNSNTNLQLLNTNYTWSGSCIMVVVKYIQSSSGNKNSWYLYGGQFVPQVGLSNGFIEWGINAIGYPARAVSSNISANENVLLCLNVGGTSNTHNALGINGTNFTLTENNTTNGNNTNNWSVCLCIGGDLTAGPAVGIAEHIIFRRGLNTTERQQMEGYLAWKWGLQSNLPSNHPYKNSAP